MIAYKFTNFINPFSRGFPDIFCFQTRYFFHGKGRTIKPHFAQQINLLLDGYIFRTQHVFQVAYITNRHTKAINSHLISRFKYFCQPLRIIHSPGNTQFMELYPGTGQFFLRLNEITGIRPQSRFVFGHHDSSIRPGKTGNPFSLLPWRGKVFAIMRICSGYDISRNIFSIHNAS